MIGPTSSRGRSNLKWKIQPLTLAIDTIMRTFQRPIGVILRPVTSFTMMGAFQNARTKSNAATSNPAISIQCLLIVQILYLVHIRLAVRLEFANSMAIQRNENEGLRQPFTPD